MTKAPCKFCSLYTPAGRSERPNKFCEKSQAVIDFFEVTNHGIGPSNKALRSVSSEYVVQHVGIGFDGPLIHVATFDERVNRSLKAGTAGPFPSSLRSEVAELTLLRDEL